MDMVIRYIQCIFEPLIILICNYILSRPYTDMVIRYIQRIFEPFIILICNYILSHQEGSGKQRGLEIKWYT
jgi:hypothetical protein